MSLQDFKCKRDLQEICILRGQMEVGWKEPWLEAARSVRKLEQNPWEGMTEPELGKLR